MMPTNIIKWMLIGLLVGSVTTTQADTIVLPNMGDSSGTLISPEQEHEIGEGVMRELRRSLKLVSDPEINEYIQSIGYRIVSNSDNQFQDFTFFIINDPTINAFAAPGGFVGINSGLIVSSESESEMAAVIAHEVAHVTQRHLARSYEAQSQLQTPSLIGLIAAVLLSTQNAELGRAALVASSAVGAQIALNFTRSNEQEADDIGMQTLARAGFDPYAMPAFFEKLQNSSRYYGQPPEFLSTHPVTVTRIAESRARAERYPYKQIPDSLEFNLTREKLIVLAATDTKQLIQDYQKNIRSGNFRTETSARYGYALALVKDGQYALARKQIDQLEKQFPNELAFKILNAQNEVAAGKLSNGLDDYKTILKLYPDNHPATVYYAQALLKNGRAKEARILLHEHLRNRAPDADMYRLQAVVEGEAGFRLEAHQSMSEYYYLTGDLPSAIQQLNIALGLKSSDFYELSKIEARKTALQNELAQRKKNS